MTQLALVTGASSGIGKDLARLHAAAGGDLVLTARRADALEALRTDLVSAYGGKVHVIALDLAAPGGAEALLDALRAQTLNIDILINNAGFGGYGRHIDRPLHREQAMIGLNIAALVTLTHQIAQGMVVRGGGKILNVGSTAGFAPGPNQAVYYATKAFVNSFSQAIDHELRPHGVTCTVLAPGHVETNFSAIASAEGTTLIKPKGAPSGDVAQLGYSAMMRGDLVAINAPGLRFAINWVLPFLPRRLVLHIMNRIQRRAPAG